MRAVEYALRQAWTSVWRSGASGALAVLAIALAMIVLGVLLLVTSNVERLLAQWGSVAEFSVYLRDDATSEDRGAIEAAIDQSGAAEQREYVSKADALRRFRGEFAELAALTDSFEDNPFPASVEVRLAAAAERDGRAEALVTRVAAMPAVADVRYDREWLASIASGLAAIRGAGFTLAVLMALAAAITVATVVRLGLHARQAEIEIMQLVGSPLAFIRGPFVAEGLLQGGVGALLALACLWIGWAAAVGWWGAQIDAMLDGASVRFLPARLCAYLVAGGMAVGSVGGFTASRHAGR